MSEQLWFIETSVSGPILLPSLAPAPTVMERGNPRSTRAKSLLFAFVPPNPRQPITAHATVLSKQPNTSFVLQKLILDVSNTKCWEAGAGVGGGGGGGVAA